MSVSGETLSATILISRVASFGNLSESSVTLTVSAAKWFCLNLDDGGLSGT